MQNNNNHKSDSTCAFSETLVAVLYDEATTRETEDFESHLTGCRQCREELSAFGMLRSAVSDWRETEFAPLVSPSIALLEENQIIEPANRAKQSVLQSLLAIFSPSNSGWQMAAGFAGIIILGLLFIGSTNLFEPEKQIADAQRPLVNATPEVEALPKVESAPKETIVAQIETSKDVSDQTQEKNRNSSHRVNQKAPKQSAIPAVSNGKLQKKRSPVSKPEQKVEDLSDLSLSEAEDNSLRLTDLLEEIEPSK